MTETKESWRDALLALCILALLALCALFCGGCQMQPSRSQTLRFTDCSVRINVYGGSATNRLCAGDILCQAMSIETGGSESQSQTETVAPSVTVPAALDPVSAGIQAGASVATTAIKASAKTTGGDCGGGACSITK